MLDAEMPVVPMSVNPYEPSLTEAPKPEVVVEWVFPTTSLVLYTLTIALRVLMVTPSAALVIAAGLLFAAPFVFAIFCTILTIPTRWMTFLVRFCQGLRVANILMTLLVLVATFIAWQGW